MSKLTEWPFIELRVGSNEDQDFFFPFSVVRERVLGNMQMNSLPSSNSKWKAMG